MEGNQTDGEADDNEGADEVEGNSNILNEIQEESKKEFNRVWGWTDLAMNVSKEIGSPYLQVMDMPCLHVLTLANYLMDKIKQIEDKYKVSR